MAWVATIITAVVLVWLLLRARRDAAKQRERAAAAELRAENADELIAALQKERKKQRGRLLHLAAEYQQTLRHLEEEKRDIILSIKDPEDRARLSGRYALDGFKWLSKEAKDTDSD